jgi:chemotaxis protein CheD
MKRSEANVRISAACEQLVMPGEFFFGHGNQALRTLLGSCVALVFWHPAARVGGLCHFLLPARTQGRVDGPRDAQYADEALAMMEEVARCHQVSLHHCDAWLFGGARTVGAGGDGGALDVGLRNQQAAKAWMRTVGLQVRAEEVGGHLPLQVRLDLASGQVSWQRTRAVAASSHLAGGRP